MSGFHLVSCQLLSIQACRSAVSPLLQFFNCRFTCHFFQCNILQSGLVCHKVLSGRWSRNSLCMSCLLFDQLSPLNIVMTSHHKSLAVSAMLMVSFSKLLHLATILTVHPLVIRAYLFFIGTHINLLKRPVSEPDLYYDRKQNWSINVLAVCNKNLHITYYFIGAYGSAHDKRVYRCSSLPEKLAMLPPGQLILGK